MEQISSIESRTRASFSRVKRDIDALKAQIAKLRARDDALDHALSDYVRSGEFYERIKRIDERFAQLSDEYVTADEFEKGVARLVKETTSLSKRIAGMEKADLSPEVASMRKELESLSRTTLERKPFDEFVDKATARIEGLDTKLERIDERMKRFGSFEKQLGSLESVEENTKRLADHDKALRKLEGLDVKALEKRLATLESNAIGEDAVRAIALNELENAVRVEELNEKIDEFNAALDSTAERGRVEALETAITELRSMLGKRSDPDGLVALADRMSDLEKRFSSERESTSKELVSASDELDTLSSRLSQFESVLGELREGMAEDIVSVSEFNEKIDEFNAVLESVGSAERFAALESAIETLRADVASRGAHDSSGIADRVEELHTRFDSERESTSKELVSVADEIERFSSRLSQFESVLGELRANMSEDSVSVSEFNEKIDEFNTALESVGNAERLAALEATVETLKTADTASVNERLDSERHATNALITGAIEQVEALAARVDELSDADPKLLKRLERLEKRLDESGSNLFEGRLDVFEARLDSLESSSGSDLAERIDDVEAQLKVVIEDMGGSGDVDVRAVEGLARDVAQLKSRLDELAEDVELSSTKERGPSAEHLQSEIEFLRSNVVMHEDLESLRSEVSSGKGAKKDNRITVLSDDLQRLFERQSELEKKVLSLETQNRTLSEARNVEISEKVPLRDPKPRVSKREPEPVRESEPPVRDDEQGDAPGTLGKVRRWMVDFFTEEVEDEPKRKKPKDDLY